MRGVRFSAVSLQDIADHFDTIAQAHADAAAQAKSERTRNSHMDQATAWRAASGYLNHCEIAPALAVWTECAHNWHEVESMFTNEHQTEVRCSNCGVTGERDERDGSVFWPAT